MFVHHTLWARLSLLLVVLEGGVTGLICSETTWNAPPVSSAYSSVVVKVLPCLSLIGLFDCWWRAAYWFYKDSALLPLLYALPSYLQSSSYPSWYASSPLVLQLLNMAIWPSFPSSPVSYIQFRLTSSICVLSHPLLAPRLPHLLLLPVCSPPMR